MAKIQYFKSKPNPHASSSEFYAVGEPFMKDGEEVRPVAEIGLWRGEYEYGYTDPRGEEGNYDPGTISHNRIAKPGDQLKLFDIQPSKITGAYADHRMRAHTPTVLGMAVNEAKKIGLGLTYSHDLSQHSSKLAKKGLELGVVVPNRANRGAVQRNDIAEDGLGSFEATYDSDWFQDYDEAKPEEVKAGRDTIRGIVRQNIESRKTASHMGEQFQDRQMKLPGFD